MKRVRISDRRFKTSRSCSTGGVFNCVSVAITKKAVGVRDTKNRRKTTLQFSREEWGTFVKAVKSGEFDV